MAFAPKLHGDYVCHGHMFTRALRLEQKKFAFVDIIYIIVFECLYSGVRNLFVNICA